MINHTGWWYAWMPYFHDNVIVNVAGFQAIINYTLLFFLFSFGGPPPPNAHSCNITIDLHAGIVIHGQLCYTCNTCVVFLGVLHV